MRYEFEHVHSLPIPTFILQFVVTLDMLDRTMRQLKHDNLIQLVSYTTNVESISQKRRIATLQMLRNVDSTLKRHCA